MITTIVGENEYKASLDLSIWFISGSVEGAIYFYPCRIVSIILHSPMQIKIVEKECECNIKVNIINYYGTL